jgi:hypothetical protein
MFLKHLNTEFKNKSVTTYVSTPTTKQYPRFIMLNQTLVHTLLLGRDHRPSIASALCHVAIHMSRIIKNEPAKNLLAEICTKRKFASLGLLAHTCARNALHTCDKGIYSITVMGVLLTLTDFRCWLRALTWSYSGLPL